jgi:L-fuculose-phosphate aldolase
VELTSLVPRHTSTHFTVSCSNDMCANCGGEGAIADPGMMCAMLLAGRRLYDKGLIAGADGNLSLRVSHDKVLVTPSGSHKGYLSCQELSLVSFDGRHLKGGNPTTELPLHLGALDARPEMKAVVHAHAPSCVAMSLMRHPQLDGVIPEVTSAIGGFCVIPYETPGSVALAKTAAKALEKYDAVVMERHGTLAVGRTIEEACARTESLEHAAHILWMTHCLARPQKLPEAEQRALREIYERGRLSATGLPG